MTPVGYEPAKILVTVKTYPTPSQRHVETVCVAGVRLDTPEPTWIRLYPIAFRSMGEQDRFKKRQIVTASIRARGTTDPRPESFSPDVQSLSLEETIDSSTNWGKRRRLISPLIGSTTTCELIRANRAVRMSEPAPSLGLIKPTVSRVELVEGKGWSPSQLAKVRSAAEPDLFSAPLVQLRPPPWVIRYYYRCQSDGCRGHKQEVIDWEVGVSGMMWENRYRRDTGSKILEKWQSMVADGKDTHFFIGNQHQHRHSFSVLGVWYPKLP